MKFSFQMLALALGVESRATIAPLSATGPFINGPVKQSPTSVSQTCFFKEDTSRSKSVLEKRSSLVADTLPESKRAKSDETTPRFSAHHHFGPILRHLQPYLTGKDRSEKSEEKSIPSERLVVQTREAGTPTSLQAVYKATASTVHGRYGNREASVEEGVDEIIKTAEGIYTSVLKKYQPSKPLTIVSPGQSPSYVALAMINLPTYNARKVDVVVLPLSKLQIDWNDRLKKQDWMQPYVDHLVREKIQIRPRMVVIDSVQSGRSMFVTRALLETYHHPKSCDVKTIALHNLYHPIRPHEISRELCASHDVNCGTHMIYWWPRLVQELDVRDIPIESPSKAAEMFAQRHFNKFTRFLDDHGAKEMEVYIKESVNGRRLTYFSSPNFITGTAVVSVLAPEKQTQVTITCSSDDQFSILMTFSGAGAPTSIGGGQVQFRIHMATELLEPADQHHWPGNIFNSQPDTTTLPVLDQYNYIGNPVARMLIQKCAAKVQAPREPIEPVCANPACRKTGVKLLTCSRCKHVKYCSGGCQRAHWKAHKCNCQRPHTFSSLPKLKKAKFYRHMVQR